jgi:hypothetical protein
MNADSYRADRDGVIIEGPALAPNTPSVLDPPPKDPRVDDQGRVIADLLSPMHRA